MSASLTPPPPSPAAGAVNGMQAPPNPIAMKFQTVVTGIRELIQIARKIPGIDQTKLEQAIQMMGQSIQIFQAALPKPGGAGAAPPTEPPQPP
jgi:hypothetical protein